MRSERSSAQDASSDWHPRDWLIPRTVHIHCQNPRLEDVDEKRARFFSNMPRMRGENFQCFRTSDCDSFPHKLCKRDEPKSLYDNGEKTKMIRDIFRIIDTTHQMSNATKLSSLTSMQRDFLSSGCVRYDAHPCSTLSPLSLSKIVGGFCSRR